MIERLSPPTLLKSAQIAPTGIFKGLASTFNGPIDSYGDIILQGAFGESLRKHASENTTPALLWAHDASEPIGVWTKLIETSEGLEVEGKLTLETQRGADAFALMKDGALALSIGFRIPLGGSKYENGGVRTISKIDLWEISAVAMPANPSARITSVKSAIRPANIRELEEALRELGFSNREAKSVASKGWNAIHNETTDNSDELAALLKAASQHHQMKAST